MNAGSVALIEITPALGELLQNPPAFEQTYGARLGDHADAIGELVRANVEFLARVPRPAPWVTYLSVQEGSRQVVGGGGFKSGPTADRTVEIAYFTLPAYERRGHATALARALFAMASESGEVDSVIAHTLPESNASNHLLQKVGFAKVGEVIDPEDGLVWRYERPCET